ncbi:Ribonucleases P/MRP protein subunit pop1 [Vanrija albida]|uniref:Ribonucleases P/MRP protein subunit pop1 n=1 Tax=Vanrija albida TaxID=181172 RepID=A0ABR3Q9I5_9TREE
MSKPGSGPKGKPAPTNGKGKPFKSIPKTSDLLNSNQQAKARGKGREKVVLKGVHDLIKNASKLPGALQVERFAEVRAIEIQALQNAVKLAAAQSNSRAFQSLPRHLRRRAASHNPRRVPKRLRSRAKAEIDLGDNTARIHKKKAKLRARGNLRGESRTAQLRSRQLDKRWLATHLFHAKRFHMINLWGYRLPLSPTLKCFRSSYRAARRQATVQDVSYFGTLELQGDQQHIIDVLAQVTSGGPIAGPRIENGSRVAHTTLHWPSAFPHRLIGPVEVLWEPQPQQPSSRRVWIRIHPSIYDEAATAIREAATSSPTGIATPLKINELRDSIESFEIMGPLAGHVLSRILHLSAPSISEKKRQNIEVLLAMDPAQIPDGTIIGCQVHDPRLTFPHSSGTSVAEPSSAAITHALLPSDDGVLAWSDLWREDLRRGISKPTFTKAQLDIRRYKMALPGSHLQPTSKDNRIPINLLKRTVQSSNADSESSAFHGFTLLIPKGWAMAFLPSFLFCRARHIGLQERRVQYREAGAPSFPEHWGATCAAGAAWEASQAREAETRWLRKPPGKRPQYSALGTLYPFRPNWPELLAGGVEAVEESAMNGEQAACQPWLFTSALSPFLQKLRLSSDRPAYLLKLVNVFRRRRGMGLLPDADAIRLFDDALCHVEVNAVGRGSPSDMAILYATNEEERAAWLQAQERDADELASCMQTDGSSSAVQHLGETIKPKEIIGFVNSGNISLTRGHGHGVATVSLKGYLGLLDAASASQQQPETALVQTRNANGIIHRLASVSLVP